MGLIDGVDVVMATGGGAREDDVVEEEDETDEADTGACRHVGNRVLAERVLHPTWTTNSNQAYCNQALSIPHVNDCETFNNRENQTNNINCSESIWSFMAQVSNKLESLRLCRATAN